MTSFEITENFVILPKNKTGIIIKDIDLNKQKVLIERYNQNSLYINYSLSTSIFKWYERYYEVWRFITICEY